MIILSWKPRVENVSKEESECKNVKTFYVNDISTYSSTFSLNIFKDPSKLLSMHIFLFIYLLAR